MQNIMRMSFMLMAPILVLIYWRNSMRELEDLHANYDLKYLE